MMTMMTMMMMMLTWQLCTATTKLIDRIVQINWVLVWFGFTVALVKLNELTVK